MNRFAIQSLALLRHRMKAAAMLPIMLLVLLALGAAPHAAAATAATVIGNQATA